MSILFCTPCYGGMVFAPHFKSCLELKGVLSSQDICHDWLIGWNESLISRGRMKMTKAFLGTDYEYMMWIDADIEFSVDDINQLWWAMKEGEDIVVAPYRMKKEGSKFAAWVNGSLIEDLDPLKDPVYVDYAGTGFMMLSRKALMDLASKVESFDDDVKDIPALYMTPIHDGILESEDYYFCRIARENGYNIRMVTTTQLKHWGIKAYG